MRLRRHALTLLLATASASATVITARDAQAQQQPVVDADAEASAQFRRGRSLYDAHRYPEALAAFRASLDLLPSPATRIYVARSLRRIPGHAVEAYREYRRAMREADERSADEPRYAPVASAARTEAGEIAGSVAVVTLSFGTTAPNDVSVHIDGEPIRGEEITGEIALEPGTHTVEARAPGYLQFRQQFDIPAGTSLRVAITLVQEAPAGAVGTVHVPEAAATGFVSTPTPTQPAARAPVTNDAQRPSIRAPGAVDRDDPGSGLRRGGGVFIGMGSVLLVAGVISAAFALGTYNGLVHDCGEGLCPEGVDDVQGRVTRGRAAGVVGTVGMATGGGLILLGAIIYGIGKSREHTPVSQVASHLVFDPFAGTMGIHGTF
jgi:hypothetical protein